MLTRTALAAGVGYLGYRAYRRYREDSVDRKVVLITGSSRGLGLLLARRFADEGARLVLCARDPEDLSTALDELEERGAEVLAVPCDVADPDDVENLVSRARERFGHIDVLVNNAGTIQVGPVENMRAQDFERAIQTMYFGMVYPTLALLPEMLARGDGHIVNITSLGGFVSVPHLLPYGGAKFAAVGFSQGLRAELKGKGVKVTTVAPSTMRVGSYLHAEVKGQTEKELGWFSLGSSLPFVSVDADRAARRIVRATKRGDGMVFLGVQGAALARLHGVAPDFTANLLAYVNRVMPAPTPDDEHIEKGWQAAERLRSRLHEMATTLGRRGARETNEYASR